MSEQQAAAQLNPALDALKQDPEYQNFLIKKEADTVIEQYAKDEVGKTLLDNGLRDRISKEPSIIKNEAALKIAIEVAREKAMAEIKKPATQNPETAPQKPDTSSAQPDAQKKSLSSMSLADVRKEVGGDLGKAVNIKMFGTKQGIINMS